jgi:hypothetical protein
VWAGSDEWHAFLLRLDWMQDAGRTIRLHAESAEPIVNQL